MSRSAASTKRHATISSICRHHPCPRPALNPYPTHSTTPPASSSGIPLAQLLAPRHKRPGPLPAHRPGYTRLQTEPPWGTFLITRVSQQRHGALASAARTQQQRTELHQVRAKDRRRGETTTCAVCYPLPGWRRASQTPADIPIPARCRSKPFRLSLVPRSFSDCRTHCAPPRFIDHPIIARLRLFLFRLFRPRARFHQEAAACPHTTTTSFSHSQSPPTLTSRLVSFLSLLHREPKDSVDVSRRLYEGQSAMECVGHG